jgi:hypothetical protein
MTSTVQLQREADATRVRLADTLGRLREGTAPSVLSGEVIAVVKDSGLSLAKTLVEQTRANPVPALLIGAGLAMMLTRTTGRDVMGAANSALKGAAGVGADAARSAASGVASAASGTASAALSAASAASGVVKEAVSGAAGRASSAVDEAAGAVRERMAGTVDQARHTAADTYASAKDKLQSTVEIGRRELNDRQYQAGVMAGEAEQRALTMAQDARQSIARLLEEQPILMAALGAALGAAVGAAFPVTKAEKDLIGSAGAMALGAGREALAGAADVVGREAATADRDSKVSEPADEVIHGDTKRDIGDTEQDVGDRRGAAQCADAPPAAAKLSTGPDAPSGHR